MAAQRQTSLQLNTSQRWPHKRNWRSCASSSRRRVRLDRLGTVHCDCAIAMRRCQSSSNQRNRTVVPCVRSARPPAEIWKQGTRVPLPLRAQLRERELRSTPTCLNLQTGWPKRTTDRHEIRLCRRYSFARLQFGPDLSNRLQDRLNLDHVVPSVNDFCGDGLGIEHLAVLCFNGNGLLF